MKQKEQKKVEDTDLPRFYRWLLKIPIPDFFDWLGRRSLFAGLLIYSLVLWVTGY